MNFSYVMSRRDLKKMYVKDFQRINLIYIIFLTFIFIMFTSNIIKYNLGAFVLYYLIVFILLFIILYLISIIYAVILIKYNDKKSTHYGKFDVNINDEGIISNSDNFKLKIKWTDVIKIIYKKDRIYIKYNNKDKLVFLINKDFLVDKTDFQKIQQFFKEKKYIYKI